MIDNKFDGTDKASFNQAFYQQQRINEIMTRIDRMSISPLDQSEFVGLKNYEVIYNDLCSILSTISPKLKKAEEEFILKYKDLIEDCMDVFPVFEKKKHSMLGGYNMKTCVNKESWNRLKELLFKFRLHIEKLMDVHGFGNPTKDDPRLASMKQ